MISSYDDMGPRIDLGGDNTPPEAHGATRNPNPPRIPGASPAPPRIAPKSGPGALGLVSLMLSLLALCVAMWGLLSQPEMIPQPPMSPSVIPGATAERVAKLEKDVGDLMLRMVTLEKEIKAVASKAGSVTKLTELSSRVAGLQDRLDALTVERKIAGLEKKAPAAAPAAPAAAPAAQAKAAPPQPEEKAQEKAAEPERQKQIYTVRRGDTLFTIAQRYKVTMRDLKSWNNLRSNMVMIDQKLVIYK
ncbi:MAG: LysM peptidoglycan-binding domain-containing protein [Proteobacteria bacterium]|nr:LysM peptidoglycan-binding domain-containing protein [Pseudomonadota bacterium]MBU4384143.1 LysM peptidoglycan-binding domain-containing protein [Pseudomonadota bacterium]MBU4605090.1 LysM peptidoglycan-binding domain-containing protein [Pseudomonadota bacterium]MCG2763781.1 LysM peptidoglycan-binding domain-containing protein [Desulfarculaceae bacterium]